MERPSGHEITFGAGRASYSLKKMMLIMPLVVITLSGCVTAPGKQTTSNKPGNQPDGATAEISMVRAGDKTGIQFSCTFKNGELVASTSGEEAQRPKSKILLAREKSTPFELTAGKDPTEVKSLPTRGFEGEIVHQLTNAVIGMRVGEKKTVGIDAKIVSASQGQQIQLARVRYRAKEMRFTPDEYEAKTGKKAAVGNVYIFDPALPGRVESVSEKEVVVHFPVKQGQQVDTPFGKGTVNETPDRYEITIDAKPGTLVRSGPMVGRIVSADDRSFTVDYSHPLAGESVVCEVTVVDIKQGERTENRTESGK